MTDSEVLAAISRAYDQALAEGNSPGLRWTMGRAFYDRMRSALLTDEHEQIRAREHALAVIEVLAKFPRHCPICPSGPFADMAALAAHVAAKSDPRNRQPSDGDTLFGIPVDVEAGGGVPRLVPPRPEGTRP